MRLASYNIRKAFGLDWRRDPHRIVDVIGELDADIVVLQEADKRLGQRPGVLPLDRLQQEHGLVLARHSLNSQSHGWHGNAILYRGEHFPTPGTERIALPAREPRGAIAAHFKMTGFIVIGAHLALTSGIRKQQLKALCAHVGNSGIPTVIAGDFNHWGRKLPVHGHEVITPGFSFHASRRVAALDRFILCGGISAITSSVHTSLKARRASDHLPVVLDFVISRGHTTC
ncbi:endonuclease/exonuclease/phosphatase family protein [Pseudophaeobacter flagellatus]|uniref:endonuclease/exonuclease/phosphatase family protein n=1 Tax=Pseudophaeobacter flagellatus TaxID=2899119 RepID=UPI001E510C75|nr:endonuclease/exonuclease/phosphatase family protein [Pseudophaeobacter flagellatus]MCD9148051.1 endonuclease/exonuclease/phosphatase family protein [Pseudophaeobacter flagellatus]